MEFELLKRDVRETAEEIMNLPKRNGNDLFGLPYHTAMSLILGIGLLSGCFLFQIVAVGWCPTVSQETAIANEVAITLGRFGYVVIFIGTAIITAVAFLGNLHETWQRLACLAVAVGFMLWGCWVVTVHRIEIHADRFVVRGPLIPLSVTYPLNDGNRIIIRHHYHNSRRSIGGSKRRRSYSIHYIRADQSETVLHDGSWGPSTWARAALHFEHEVVWHGFE